MGYPDQNNDPRNAVFPLYKHLFVWVEIFSPQLSLFTNTTWAHEFTCRISDVASEWKKWNVWNIYHLEIWYIRVYIYINIYYGIYTHFFLNILDIIQIYTECIYIYMPMTPLKRQALEQRLDAVEVGWDGHGFSIDKNHVGWLKPWGFTHSFVEQLCWETFTLIVFFKNPSWVLYIYI